MRRTLAWPGPALLAAALCAGACGDKKDSAGPTAKGTEASATGARPAPTGPVTGGYLVLPSLEPPSLNPVVQATYDEATPLIFEGLVGLDARLEPRERLAAKWAQSPDGKTLIFHLRPGVTWHDGKPFGADDVVFTVEQIRSAKVPSNWSGYLASVDKVEAVDPLTVKVTYKEPYGPALATWTFGIIPKHLFAGKDLSTTDANQAPIGTGPFKFVRWTPKKSIVLEANAAWWDGRPYLDKIEIVFDAAPDELAALRAGRLDFAEITRPDDWSGEAETPEFREKYEVTEVEETSFFVVAWNCQRKPFSDRRVRVALAHALDRPRVIEDVLNGAGHALSGPFYPTMWGADPAIAPWPHDPAKAAAGLDEAGLRPRGTGARFTVELIVLEARRGAPFDEMMAVFRADLGAVGVDLKVTYLSPADFVARLTRHDFDAAFYQWIPDIADPDPYVLLHSTQAKNGANYAGWANAEADKLLDAGHRSADRADRKKVYQALHAIVHAEEPYTFLYVPHAHYAWNRRVHQVNPNDVTGLPRFPGVARWWVAP